MKALLWKELRENYRWALLALLVLGAAESYGLYHAPYPGQVDLYYNDGITLCRKPFLLVTSFGCAATGLALGLLQVLSELKRDRWAALLHRPLPRGHFFAGKAVAGALLYLLAAGLPFLGAVWLVATPGNFSTPFLPAMCQPGLADLATGLCYYFAGLLMALEGGSRLLRAAPLLAAVYASFHSVTEKSFPSVVAASLALALVLALAGWGAMHARESLRARPWPGRIALLIVAFYGACGLGDFAKALGGFLGHPGEQRYSTWQILDNGVPAHLSYVEDSLVSATDVNGQPFTDPKYRADRVRSHTLGVNAASSYIGDAHGWHEAVYEASYRDTRSYLYALGAYQHPRFEQWFELVVERRFIGMLPEEKRAFASLGPEGFGPPEARGPGFAREQEPCQIRRDLLVFTTPGELRYASLARREVTTLPLPAPGPIYGVAHSWASTTASNSIDFVGVALGTGMAVCDAKARVVALLPYHRDTGRWGQLTLGVLGSLDRYVLQYVPSEWIPWETRRTLPSYTELMDTRGTVLASYTLPPGEPDSLPKAWSSLLARHLQSPASFWGGMGWRGAAAALGSARLRGELAKQWGRDRAQTIQTGVVVSMLALALAALTWAWARRSQMTSRGVLAWTGLVLALGLPGFLVFCVAGPRPQTVPCPACGRPRRIDEEECGQCAAPWPARGTDGTEIMDAPEAVIA